MPTLRRLWQAARAGWREAVRTWWQGAPSAAAPRFRIEAGDGVRQHVAWSGSNVRAYKQSLTECMEYYAAGVAYDGDRIDRRWGA